MSVVSPEESPCVEASNVQAVVGRQKTRDEKTISNRTSGNYGGRPRRENGFAIITTATHRDAAMHLSAIWGNELDTDCPSRFMQSDYLQCSILTIQLIACGEIPRGWSVADPGEDFAMVRLVSQLVSLDVRCRP